MAKRITKTDEKTLRELSHIFRYELLPPFSEGYVTSMSNSAAKKRRTYVRRNLAQSFNNGVSDINKALGNLMAAGITCLMQGLGFMGSKLIWNALQAKGCDDGFIHKVMDLIKKAPKLVLEVCWPSSETMSPQVIDTWKPGWQDFDVNANEFKFEKEASIKTD